MVTGLLRCLQSLKQRRFSCLLAMSKHQKVSILVNGDEHKSSLMPVEPCDSLSSSKTCLYSDSNKKELNLSWRKSVSGKSKGPIPSTGSKKFNAWISSSFGGFDKVVAFQDKPKKSKQANIDSSFNKGSSQQPVVKKLKRDEDLWLEKYKPKSEVELAVHKKKVAEVRSWLLDHLTCKQPSNAILLLTGPAGVGKTATMHVLASELGFELQEWINPVADTTEESEYSNWRNWSQSQVKQFQDFILRANKYPTLSIFSGKASQNAIKKIILIEDLPNVFFREATKLHEVLSSYQLTGRSPVVFIVSDSHHGDSNVHKLFPKDVQYKLGIHNISFNPVAHTSLVKALNRITSLESQQNKLAFLLPSKETVDLLVQNSGGDIRTAINGLQFSCLKEKPFTSTKKLNLPKKEDGKQKGSKSRTSKSEKPSKSDGVFSEASQSACKSQCLLYGKADNKLDSENITAIGGRDTALFLFRALGKILYCKRDPTLSDVDLLPSHLSQHARNLLTFSPEEVLGRTHLSSDMFNLYLHQNYLEFFSDIEDVVRASEQLSDADYLTKEWMHQSSMREYSSCLVARGLIFNSNRPGGSLPRSSGAGRGWRPLHKPQWFDVNKKMKEGCNTARDLFRGQNWPSIVLQTEILPYLAITDVPLRTPGQISFLQVISNFKKSKSPFRGAPDSLDEKDCGTESDDDDSLRCSQPKGLITQRTAKGGTEEGDSQATIDLPEDVEDIIEDFDDDDG